MKAKSKERYLAPDPVYGDPLVTRFVNNLMIGGKKVQPIPLSTKQWSV